MIEVNTIIAALRRCHEDSDCHRCPLGPKDPESYTQEQLDEMAKTCDELQLRAADLLEKAADIIGKTDYACDLCVHRRPADDPACDAVNMDCWDCQEKECRCKYCNDKGSAFSWSGVGDPDANK